MKKYFLLFLLLSPFVLKAQSTEEDFPVGKINRSTFFDQTNKETYEPEYKAYHPNGDAIKYLESNKRKFKIKLVMGFWCDDSKKYVPQLFKILDQANWSTDDNDQLKIFGVDKNKQAAFEGFKSLNIVKVPTIIVYFNAKEIGRIEEIPIISIEQDLVTIMKSIEY